MHCAVLSNYLHSVHESMSAIYLNINDSLFASNTLAFLFKILWNLENAFSSLASV